VKNKSLLKKSPIIYNSSEKKMKGVIKNKSNSMNPPIFHNPSKNFKGVVKILEVVLAASILLIGLGFIFIPKHYNNVDPLKQEGYNSLDLLYNDGTLRSLVVSSDNTRLNSELDPLISYNFKAVFCKDICDTVSLQKDVIVIDYYISGYVSDNGLILNPKKVRLYLWE